MNPVLTTAAQVQQRVRQALEDKVPLALVGGDTKAMLGRKVEEAEPLELGGLASVVSYEPKELILVARPGTLLKEVEQLLEGEKQHLAFEPPHWGAGATLGGTVACGLSGPRRFKAGALRDFILGVEWVDGHGQLIKAGGKVVKNVTGYDLAKVMAGSFGTLGALTEVCFKVWPRPEYQQTLALKGMDGATALQRMLEWARLPWEISGLAHVGGGDTYVRIEGPEPAVKMQVEGVLRAVEEEVEVLSGEASAAFWRSWRELEPFQPRPGEALWRFVQPATRVLALVEALKTQGLARWGMDWGGGLLWAVLAAAGAGEAVHRLAGAREALGWRFAAGPEDDNRWSFASLDEGVGRLNEHLKRAFDPQGIFNPKKMG